MVEHLTFEELVEFTSKNSEDFQKSSLACRVVGHIRSCQSCRSMLAAMQDTLEILRKTKSTAFQCNPNPKPQADKPE